MPEITLTVHHEEGLHARPAVPFVNTAKRFKCNIAVGHGGVEANAKSILRVLALGVNQGSAITIRAEGEGAEEALAALEALIHSDFEESR